MRVELHIYIFYHHFCWFEMILVLVGIVGVSSHYCPGVQVSVN